MQFGESQKGMMVLLKRNTTKMMLNKILILSEGLSYEILSVVKT